MRGKDGVPLFPRLFHYQYFLKRGILTLPNKIKTFVLHGLTIQKFLRNPAPYRITIYNAQGRRLWETEAGMWEHNIAWHFGVNGMNGNGVYVVKVMSAKETASTRFMIMR
jgi:hypothetical protein